MSNLKQNPTTRLGNDERQDVRWSELKRSCDNPERNFAKIRTKSLIKPEIEETKGGKNG